MNALTPFALYASATPIDADEAPTLTAVPAIIATGPAGYSTPTDEMYDGFQHAYDWFNTRLFNAKLPQCLITMNRGRKYAGYYSPKKFKNRDIGSETDEIAMNPQYFIRSSVEDILSTLVHEMVHLAQHHYGKPTRANSHNVEWGKMMDAVDLTPSHTGLPGGRRTGQRMSHIIIPGGRFDVACRELLETGFRLPWGDAKEPDALSKQKRESKTKYRCPTCGQNAWAKPHASIVCGDDGMFMEPMS